MIKVTYIYILILLVSQSVLGKEISIERLERGDVVATYTFDKKIERFSFLLNNQNTRVHSWQALNPCAKLNKDSVQLTTDCQNYKSLQIKLTDNGMFQNREYPAILEFSNKLGAAINLTYFLPLDASEIFRLCIKKENSDFIIYKNKIHKKNICVNSQEISKISEFILIGKKSLLSKSKIYVADKSTPKWVIDTIKEYHSKSISFYEKNFNIKYMKQQKVIISYYPDSINNFWWGDVDENGLISLRLYGKKWMKEDQNKKIELINFISHETFHLYNANLFNSSERENSAWLHEGSAEAAALFSLYNFGIYDDKSFNIKVKEKLNSCLIFHREKGDMSANERRTNYNSIYSCGFVAFLQPDAEISVKLKSENFFNRWNAIFGLSKNRQYSIKDYMDQVDAEPDRNYIGKITAIDIYISAIEILGKFNKQYELKEVNESNVKAISNLVLLTLKENCNGNYGFWTTDNEIILEKSENCSMIERDTPITHINDKSIFLEAKKIYAELNKECTLINFQNPSKNINLILKCPEKLNPYSNFYLYDVKNN